MAISLTLRGAEQFAFLYKVFFSTKFSCRSSEHEKKPRLVFCSGRIAAKVPDKFQVCWIFYIFTGNLNKT